MRSVALRGDRTDSLCWAGWFILPELSGQWNIAKWNGSNWSALGNGLPGSAAVEALAVMGMISMSGEDLPIALGGLEILSPVECHYLDTGQHWGAAAG